MIQLSKEATYSILQQEIKLEAIKKRYKFKTLHEWWCLNCGTPIFVNYDITTHTHLFCNDPDCRASYTFSKVTIIQQQYLKRLKESQQKAIESINFNHT